MAFVIGRRCSQKADSHAYCKDGMGVGVMALGHQFSVSRYEYIREAIVSSVAYTIWLAGGRKGE